MDKQRALQYFIKVAETQSFSEAARAFAVPASSISRRISDLENMLDTKLLMRSTRSVALTELGRLYYNEIKNALAIIDNADLLVGEQSRSPSGILRITSTSTFGELKLLPAIKKLKQRYPEIVFDINFSDAILDLTGNSLDIAIRSSNTLPDNLIARELFAHRYILVATPKFLEIYGIPKTTEDLTSFPSVLYRGPDKIMHWQASSQNKWLEVMTTPTFISNHGQSLLDAVLEGDGLALFPVWAVTDYLKSGELQEVEIRDTAFSLTREVESTMYLLYHPPKFKLQKVRLAIDFLIKEFSHI